MSRAAQSSAPRPLGPPAARFRTQIDAAIVDGVNISDMTLRLTLTDLTKLKRDATVPLADISFTGGVMRYLGVKVEQGGVTESVLDRGAA
ncbi:MAG: hypothetical protein KKE02_11850 [Alphaproteobacteria bacterium]|nr:hypothetical protein [Alphaproteobacteria bacterium]MBU1513968.1 hypothetical protein [Alphaproteobacteria bacterium]MBU2093092.1 hypothetical protein [Alphaproteobacteria bacterium]MBU2151705.1 hypothetical protein [Alphaproteobacteria bacterium]MBU2309475.1 hypothetical protein [Alphaproteobacteria bacterium]